MPVPTMPCDAIRIILHHSWHLSDQWRQGACCKNLPDYRGLPPCLVPLTAARTTGSQCIQRSELYAIARIVELFVAGQVHTDSALAIHHVNQCAKATALHQVQQLSDFDLVSRLFRCPNLSQHNLVRVKAHVDPHTVPHLLTAYQTLGNQLANDKAIQACWNHLPALVSEYWSLHLQYELEKEHLLQYCRFLLELFQCRRQMEQQHPVDEGQQQLQTPQSRKFFWGLEYMDGSECLDHDALPCESLYRRYLGSNNHDCVVEMVGTLYMAWWHTGLSRHVWCNLDGAYNKFFAVHWTVATAQAGNRWW